MDFYCSLHNSVSINLDFKSTVLDLKLETNERMVIVELMMKANNDQGAIEITKKILEKIPRNDILEKISAVNSRPTGC